MYKLNSVLFFIQETMFCFFFRNNLLILLFWKYADLETSGLMVLLLNRDEEEQSQSTW